jgi:hypothetical protein
MKITPAASIALHIASTASDAIESLILLLDEIDGDDDLEGDPLEDGDDDEPRRTFDHLGAPD